MGLGNILIVVVKLLLKSVPFVLKAVLYGTTNSRYNYNGS